MGVICMGVRLFRSLIGVFCGVFFLYNVVVMSAPVRPDSSVVLFEQVQDDILLLWERFDLLHACRVLPEERVGLVLGCDHLVCDLLKQLTKVLLVLARGEGGGVVNDVKFLRSYFDSMKDSFVFACEGSTMSRQEKYLFHVLSALEQLFLALSCSPEDQNKAAIRKPTRWLAFVAAIDPSA